MGTKIKPFLIFLLKTIFLVCFIPTFFWITYWGTAFITGDRYQGYGGAPYSVRVKILEKTINSVKVDVLAHSIMYDQDPLMEYPSVKIKNVTPLSITQFNNFEIGQTVLIKTNVVNDTTEKQSKKVLDVIKVEKNRFDPFYVDFFNIWSTAILSIIFIITIFVYKKELLIIIKFLKNKIKSIK